MRMTLLLSFIVACFFGGQNSPTSQSNRTPQLVARLDWDTWAGPNPGSMSLHATGIVSPLTDGFEYGATTIDGQRYWGCCIPDKNRSSGKPSVLDFYVRALPPLGSSLQVYIQSSLVLQVDLKNFTGGVLRDTRTHKQYTPPFILEPGEYHLEATKTRQPATSQPARTPTTAPSSANALE